MTQFIHTIPELLKPNSTFPLFNLTSYFLTEFSMNWNLFWQLITSMIIYVYLQLHMTGIDQTSFLWQNVNFI